MLFLGGGEGVSDYAANLGVSPAHKTAVSKLENDSAAITRLCF